MKNSILTVIAIISLSFFSCKKKEKEQDNTGKSLAQLTAIFIDNTKSGVPVAGCNVCFTSNAIGAKTSKWDFGDGKTSTEALPCHTYEKDGPIVVKLKLDNDDSVTATNAFYVCKPPILTASMAGIRTWRNTFDSVTRIAQYKITYIDPATITIDGTKVYFMSSVEDAGVTTVEYNVRVNGYVANFTNVKLKHTATSDTMYYVVSGGSLGNFYYAKYVTP
ncbi:MAG: cell surface protein [Flavipsychrobacter sp.]|nr:cell surface protein [Flavipsychrobacter sp.]